MRYWGIFAVAFFVGFSGSWVDAATSTPGSPVGVWETTVRGKSPEGKETGIGYAAFAENGEFIWYGMTTNSLGHIWCKGTWSNGPKAIESTSVTLNSVVRGIINQSATLSAKAKGKKIQIVLRNTSGSIELKISGSALGADPSAGQALVDSWFGRTSASAPVLIRQTPNLAGAWHGALDAQSISFELQATDLPGLHQISANEDVFGLVLTSTKGSVYAYFGVPARSNILGLSGKYNTRKRSVMLKGVDYFKAKVTGAISQP